MLDPHLGCGSMTVSQIDKIGEVAKAANALIDEQLDGSLERFFAASLVFAAAWDKHQTRASDIAFERVFGL